MTEVTGVTEERKPEERRADERKIEERKRGGGADARTSGIRSSGFRSSNFRSSVTSVTSVTSENDAAGSPKEAGSSEAVDASLTRSCERSRPADPWGPA